MPPQPFGIKNWGDGAQQPVLTSPPLHPFLMVAQTIKNLPAIQETRVQSLSQEDPLEKEMQATPVFLPREFHGQRSLVGYSSWGSKDLDKAE